MPNHNHRDDFRGGEFAERDRNTGYGYNDGALGPERVNYRGQSGSQSGGAYDQAWRGQGVRGGSEGRWGDMDQGGRSRGPHAGKGPRGFQRSDERIREMVHEALTDHEHIDATDITVAVENGEVTLAGTVDDRSTKRRAEDVVAAVSGVKDVHNQLRLTPSHS